MRLPSSSRRPSPTARTLPFCGFSLAVSGRTRPDAVVSSSSIARTISRSPRGLSFISKKPPLVGGLATSFWHSRLESASDDDPHYIEDPARAGINFERRRTRRSRAKRSKDAVSVACYARMLADRSIASDRRSVRTPLRAAPSAARSILGAADALHRLGHAGGLVQDLREPHDRDDILHRDRPPVDLFEKVDEFLVAAELGVVVLDVARGEVGEAHHLDLVDDRFEDPFPRRVLVADRHEHRLVLAVLARLVAEPDRRRLAAPQELVGEDGRVEVENLHYRRQAIGLWPSGPARAPPSCARPRR